MRTYTQILDELTQSDKLSGAYKDLIPKERVYYGIIGDKVIKYSSQLELLEDGAEYWKDSWEEPEGYTEAQQYQRDLSGRVMHLFEQEVLQEIHEYNLTKEQAQRIFDYAYEEKHSSVDEVGSYAVELANLFSDLLNA